MIWKMIVRKILCLSKLSGLFHVHADGYRRDTQYCLSIDFHSVGIHPRSLQPSEGDIYEIKSKKFVEDKSTLDSRLQKWVGK